MFCWLLAGDAGPVRAAAPSEYEVKAAFLVNFGGFVRWPADSFASPQSPFVICIVGKDPFAGAFTQLSKKNVGGRPLEVKYISSSSEAPKTCHLLFVAETERPRLQQMLSELRRAPVLTVSDRDGFVGDGGMIGLFTSERKIRFEINRTAAEAAGLKIDARLLNLAEPARSDGGENRR